ncbi:MAG: glycine--tRNA ligase [Desulfurococcales archaeon ex4484_217_1]|nr:MAG: glycine--tRNA ligase [Desulfurococcales archaeon ex4484_217_1]
MSKEKDLYEKIVELAARRGFFWRSYEIYGGVAGFVDLGPLGAALKKNIEEKWREWFILKHQDFIVEIETPVITPRAVLEASGHLEHFTDPIVECRKCGRKFRADHLIEDEIGEPVEGLKPHELSKIIKERNIKCPMCGGNLSEVREFSLLFQTTIGPYSENVGFLRPEAAQGMFTSFKRVYEAMRGKLPLGIGQIGKVGRNEISPRQGVIRLREFTIMEVEFFFDPEEPTCPLLPEVENDELRLITCNLKMKGIKEPLIVTVMEGLEKGLIVNEWLAYFLAIGQRFVKDLGIPLEKQVFEEKLPHERAHYSTQTFDQLVKVSRWGWIEVAGHSYRGRYDLSRHIAYSRKDLTVYKQFKEPKILKVEELEIDVEKLKEFYGEHYTKIVREFSESDKNILLRELESKGYLSIAGFKIPKEFFKVKTVAKKVKGKRFIPHVVEPSFGAERLLYATLEYAYSVRNGRVVLKLPKDIAPISVAVFPLVNKEPIVKIAKETYENLKSMKLRVLYDVSGSIGRRYARADEIGVPLALTVDYRSVEDDTVTLRNRDTWEQIRVKRKEVYRKIPLYIKGEISFEQLGEPA